MHYCASRTQPPCANQHSPDSKSGISPLTEPHAASAVLEYCTHAASQPGVIGMHKVHCMPLSWQLHDIRLMTETVTCASITALKTSRANLAPLLITALRWCAATNPSSAWQQVQSSSAGVFNCIARLVLRQRTSLQDLASASSSSALKASDAAPEGSSSSLRAAQRNIPPAPAHIVILSSVYLI